MENMTNAQVDQYVRKLAAVNIAHKRRKMRNDGVKNDHLEEHVAKLYGNVAISSERGKYKKRGGSTEWEKCQISAMLKREKKMSTMTKEDAAKFEKKCFNMAITKLNGRSKCEIERFYPGQCSVV